MHTYVKRKVTRLGGTCLALSNVPWSERCSCVCVLCGAVETCCDTGICGGEGESTSMSATPVSVRSATAAIVVRGASGEREQIESALSRRDCGLDETRQEQKN